MAQHQNTKTGGTAPDIRRTPNLHKTSNIRKVLNIREILLPLDGLSGTHGVSKVREDRAYRLVLDAEEVTVSPSTNAKGLRILFSKDLYIYLIEED